MISMIHFVALYAKLLFFVGSMPSSSSFSIIQSNNNYNNEVNRRVKKLTRPNVSTSDNNNNVNRKGNDDNTLIQKNKNRRQVLKTIRSILPTTALIVSNNNANAIEETKATDEVTITIPKSSFNENKEGLGIELSELTFRSNKRVYVKSIKPNSISDVNNIKPNYIFVSINNISLERTDAKGVFIYFKRLLEDDTVDNIIVTFRDPSAFNEQLSNLEEGQSAITQVAPSRGNSKQELIQDEQKVSVTQIKASKNKVCAHPADTNDLLEISYVGTVLPSGQLFDSTNLKINGKEIPGRGGDITVYFVLGKQPLGQFPPAWDVSLYGMCIGETRRIVVPPILAYGEVGVPRRGIPPNATLQYDVTLVSVNGLAVDNTPVYEKYNF